MSTGGSGEPGDQQLPPENGNALTMQQVWCGEGTFPPRGLPDRAFVIAYGWTKWLHVKI